MTVLSLLLAAPLQAWGTSSRFTTRSTDPQPSKSGVIGMLAAARGLRRTDPLEDLLTLRFAVRVEQPGELVRDFQTARFLPWDDRRSSDERKNTMPLSYRYYQSDARYLVGLEGEASLLEGLAEALRSPTFPLYLGRRSCPPSEPLNPIAREGSLEDLLVEEPWRPAAWYKRRMSGRPEVLLPFTIDAAPGRSDPFCSPLAEHARGYGTTTTRDEPISFDPQNRLYGWRTVVSGMLPAPGTPVVSASTTKVSDQDSDPSGPDFMGVFA